MSELKYFNSPSNYNRIFSNTEFIAQLTTNIKNRLGRQILSTEKMFIINLLKSINPVVFDKKSPTEIMSRIEERIISEISKQNCSIDDTVNIHEMLKLEIGVSTEDGGTSEIPTSGDAFVSQVTSSFANQTEVTGLLGTKSMKELVTLINPETINKTAYMYLDTKYRILDDDGTSSFKWNFVNNATFTQGTVNILGDIKDITEIKVYPLKIPYIAQADNRYNRITMFIEEFSAQAFIAQENRKFHFIFPTEITDRFIELNPKDDNCGVFKFKTPISHLETITISFGSPLQNIIFDVDRRNMIIDSYGTVTQFICPYAHNLSTGDLVYISNFSTNNTSIDNVIITAINSRDGNTITWISNDIFSIDVDSSSLYITGPGTISIDNSTQEVIGVNTSFTTLFSYNDIIIIEGFLDGVPTSNPYVIGQVISDTILNLQGFYNEDDANAVIYQRNNTIGGLQTQVYFGAKRIFIALELHYNESVTN